MVQNLSLFPIFLNTVNGLFSVLVKEVKLQRQVRKKRIKSFYKISKRLSHQLK